MMTDRLARMFDQQIELQKKMGHDFIWMSREERIDYFKEMVLGLTDELHEALAEMGWKSWSSSRHINEEKVVGELVDAFHFLLNLFLSMNVDVDEVFERYQAKHTVNNTRQQVGYDGVTTKCANPYCRRALDEPGAALPYTSGNAPGLAWCNDGCYDAWGAITSHERVAGNT